MTEYESLLDKILEQKPELLRSDIEERIKQKKEKIGAGYLTDQGALFLIASDLGVSLSEPLKVEMNLKDLFVGAKEISLESRVLSLAPAKQYTRKDGSPFLLRKSKLLSTCQNFGSKRQFSRVFTKTNYSPQTCQILPGC